ncbi:Peptidoglycan O-acetyltransferase [anaerobic digester metagenome]
MVFSSITFLFCFLPAALLLCHAVPARWQNGALLLVSLVFYGWGEPRSLWVLLLSLLAGWWTGRAIEDSPESRKRFWLTASLVVSLGALALFKYADFLLATLSALTGTAFLPLGLKLPIGISFYTFQMVSYTLDVYRGTVPAQRRLVDLAAYITMFPQLIAGPIVRYSDIQPQLERRSVSLADAALGLRRFLLGLGKKVLLANTLGSLVETARTTRDPSLLFLWLYAAAFCLQIYYDFSGYSDMAIGLGKLLGFSFMENFNYPFTARSITDFWRRWHISLGTWFRDYVYVPLGGNRCSRPRWIRNLILVWGLTGLWHGAAWNFVLWGLGFALVLLAEKLWLSRILEKIGGLRHVYVLLLIAVSFVLFDSTNLPLAWTRISGLFGAGDLPLVSPTAWYQLRSYGWLLIVAALGSTPWPARTCRALEGSRAGMAIQLTEPPFLLGLAVCITAFLVDGSFNPFLYFRF